MEETPVTSQQAINPEEKQGSKFTMAGKTIALIIVLTFVTGGLLWLAFSKDNKEPVATQIPTVTPDPVQTVLSISSVPTPLASPSSYQTDVIINTGQNKINSVQLELLYDPKIIKNVDIVAGGFFIDPLVKLKNIDQETGRITYVLNASGGTDNGVLGQGIIAQIKYNILKSQKEASTFISFQPKTQVLGVGFSNSLLKSTVDASFTIGNIIPTRAPTATPSGNF